MTLHCIPHAFDIEVGARVRVLREMQQMSPAELGAAIGVSGEQIQRYEAGAGGVSDACLTSMANALGVKLSVIFGGANDPLEREIIDHIGATSRQATEVAQAFDRIADPLVRNNLAQLIDALGTSGPPLG